MRHVARFDIQIGIGLLVACALPILVHLDWTTGQGLTVILSSNPIVVTAMSVFAGCLSMRRIAGYPQVKACACVLPVFTITYAVALFGCTFLSLPYSRIFFAVSFASTLMWFIVVYLLLARVNIPTFAVIPFGDAERLADIDGVRWNFVSQPHLACESVDGLIVDWGTDLPDKWSAFVFNAVADGVPVHHVKQISESLTGRVDIKHLSENTFCLQLPEPSYAHVKRVVDVIAIIMLLPVLVPLFAVVAVIIAADSPGPVFFRQERVGYCGRTFVIWKFRTMIHEPHLLRDRENAMTKDNDMRITRFGRFLRKSRVDELPQVINILKGEMSWIGPRPEALELSRWYQREIPHYRYRHIALPGITGWAQVNQGHVTLKKDVQNKLCYDFYYIKNLSVWLDIYIVFRTVRVMLTFFGAR